MTRHRLARIGARVGAGLFSWFVACSNPPPTPQTHSTLCSDVPAGCWQCTQSQCPADWSCIHDKCGDYWPCLCACAAGDENCFAGCQSKSSAACATCMLDIGTCEESQCFKDCAPAGRGSPVAGLACVTTLQAACADPTLRIAFCYFGASAATCTSAYYAVGTTVFACASCLPEDIVDCEARATAACGGTGL